MQNKSAELCFTLNMKLIQDVHNHAPLYKSLFFLTVTAVCVSTLSFITSEKKRKRSK